MKDMEWIKVKTYCDPETGRFESNVNEHRILISNGV